MTTAQSLVITGEYLRSPNTLDGAKRCGRAQVSGEPEWVRAFDGEGDAYYYNVRTGARAWSAPAAGYRDERPGERSPGRHCHSTLPLAVIDCHCLGIYTVILLPLLSFSAKMIVSPWARRARAGPQQHRDARAPARAAGRRGAGDRAGLARGDRPGPPGVVKRPSSFPQ